MLALCRRFTSLDPPRRRLVFEAAALMVFVWVGLRLVPFLTLRRILDRYAGPRAPMTDAAAHRADIDSVRWVITAVAARIPPATCLVQAVAADAMLRRRGIAAELRFGVRLPGAGGPPIEGHAWVECEDGETIGMAAQHSDFEVLTAASSR